MELNTFIYLIKNKLGVIFTFVAIFFVLGIGLTLVQPLKHSSNLRLLVVQDASGSTDPYATTRGNEYLSEVLSKVSYSTSFYNQVLGSGLGVDSNYFGNTNKKIAKTWSKTIEVKPVANTGIISVTAYHPKKDQAEKIARGIGSVLITQNRNYHGLGDKVSLKLLDDPITSKYPVKPNLILNAVLSLVLGLIFSLSFIYLFPEVSLASKKNLIETNWQHEDASFNQLNLHQEAEKIDYRSMEEVAPADLDSMTDEESKIDWYKNF